MVIYQGEEGLVTEYYLDFETEGLDPSRHKIITIQYQELDMRTGSPKGSLTILREWESSEAEIVSRFLEVLNPTNDFDFIPVGFNLRFELFFLRERVARVLNQRLDDRWVFYGLPRIDIKSTLVMINGGRLKGTTLDWFVRKEAPNWKIPDLYHAGEFDAIERYFRDEAEKFVHAYRFLKQELPPLYQKYLRERSYSRNP